FTFTNRCGGTVWPGVLANSGSAPLETTGFALGPGEARSLAAPAGWSGRFWARTGCAFDGTSGGKCATGDCGSGEAECHGSGAAPPATLVEFTLGGGGGGKEDYYDVSLVDGYNVPVVVEPSAAGCPATGCLVDLNERCPPELRAAEGCRSACEAFDRPEYCCSGAFGGPDTCRPSAYSQAFKAACPRAYSYAYDDATSTFTCAASAAYSVTFCPRAGTSSSLKSSNATRCRGRATWSPARRSRRTRGWRAWRPARATLPRPGRLRRRRSEPHWRRRPWPCLCHHSS
uniref:Thaumatin-like protein n=1 Tax=Aegilops tauschii subsp. strangulata TaxID=200361 RepID=A0A453LGC7_AEGTS